MPARRRWIKPQLIVLTRGKPEEAVLAACKSPVHEAPGPNRHVCSGAPPVCSQTQTS